MAIYGNPILIGGKQETPKVPFDVYSKFTSTGLTSSSWTSDDGTKTVSRAAGTWTVSGGQLIADGSTYYNIAFPRSYGSLTGIRCTIDSSFVPRNTSTWYQQSCIVGCELANMQKDFALTLYSTNGAVYPCIGNYSTNLFIGSKPITFGVEHDLFIFYSGRSFGLWMDGEMVVQRNDVELAGTDITTMGVFWNKSAGNTAVKGKIAAIGVWTFNGDVYLPSLD